MIFRGDAVPPDFRVPGFRFAGIACGIKGDGRPDLALVVGDGPCAAAGVFTTNQMAAPPVLRDRALVRRGVAQAIVVNSGNANAGTGARGAQDAEGMARLAAATLGIDARHVLVASTGMIGRYLPMDRIRAGMKPLVAALSPTGLQAAAHAIMTTDSRPKVVAARDRMGRHRVHLAAIAKGAGMIHPHMATTLSVIVSDVAIAAPLLRRVLRATVDDTFNTITVDGAQSPNDTCLALANGRAGNVPLVGDGAATRQFAALVKECLGWLAQQVVSDGEGATKTLIITVRGARSVTEARRLGFAVGNSNLVKAAFFGRQVNWGRIVAALGASTIRLKPERLAVAIAGVPVVARGVKIRDAAEARAARRLGAHDIPIEIALGLGRASATVSAADLTYEYVKINAFPE